MLTPGEQSSETLAGKPNVADRPINLKDLLPMPMKHSTFLRKITSLMTLIFLVSAGVQMDTAKAQLAGGKVKATIGAWQISCGKPPGSKVEKCAAVQSVTAEDRPNVGLTVIFQKSDRKSVV